MSYIFLVIKGMLFGIANLIPGVSGGTIAVISGIYDKLINSISNIFKKFKESIKFLSIFLIGAVIAVLLFSKVLSYSQDHFKVATYCLFIGLILGGFPSLYKVIHKKYNILNVILMILAFSIVIGLLFIPKGKVQDDDLKLYNYILLFICGILASIAMVVPGVSGMMMLEVMGYRELFTDALNNLTDFSKFIDNMKILVPVGLGIIVGLFSACILMSFLLKKYKIQTFFAIIGFVIASVIVLIYKMGVTDSIPEIIVSIILIPVGFTLTFLLDYYSNKKEKKELLKEEINDINEEDNNG